MTINLTERRGAPVPRVKLVATLGAVLALVEDELCEPWSEDTERLAQRIRDAVADAIGAES